MRDHVTNKMHEEAKDEAEDGVSDVESDNGSDGCMGCDGHMELV